MSNININIIMRFLGLVIQGVPENTEATLMAYNLLKRVNEKSFIYSDGA